MADTYDYLKVSDGTGDAALMHVTTPRTIGATVIQVDTVVGVPAFFIATYGTLLSSGLIDPTTKRDFYGHTSAGTLVIDGFCVGSTDNGNTSSQVVVIKPNTQWANDIVALAQKEHHNDGTHGAVTADSLLVAGQDITLQNLYRNAIINGGCLVAQRAVPNISTSYQYGTVDRFAAKATGTAVSAGTIAQNTGALLASQIANGAEIKLAGVTITGTGIVYLRYRIEAKDAQYFKNTAASFQCRVYHDTGSTLTATININKPTVADNFTSTTLIASLGSLSVPTATGTTLKMENINAGSLGDCSNGLEIEIQIACGAVTTRNFYFADFCLIKSAKAAAYGPRPIEHELLACQRYYEKSYDYANPPGTIVTALTQASATRDNGSGVSGVIKVIATYKVRKRAAPTHSWYNPVTGTGTTNSRGEGTTGTNYTTPSSNVSFETGAALLQAMTSSDFDLSACWTADAEL